MGKHSKEKQAMKKKQRAVHALQQKLAQEIIETFKKEGNRDMYMEEIVECYVDEDRKAEGDAHLLKQYVMMGLGPMVHDGRIKPLETEEDGRQKLHLVQKEGE